MAVATNLLLSSMRTTTGISDARYFQQQLPFPTFLASEYHATSISYVFVKSQLVLITSQTSNIEAQSVKTAFLTEARREETIPCSSAHNTNHQKFSDLSCARKSYEYTKRHAQSDRHEYTTTRIATFLAGSDFKLNACDALSARDGELPTLLHDHPVPHHLFLPKAPHNSSPQSIATSSSQQNRRGERDTCAKPLTHRAGGYCALRRSGR